MAALLDCPVCQAPLAPFKFNSVETDVCAKGCGVWLDKGVLAELEKGESSQDALDAAFPGLHQKNEDVKASLEAPHRMCPVDHNPLSRYEWNLGSGLVFDRCLTCEGLWLDAGELEGYSASVKKFREHPPELTPEIQAKMAAAKAKAEGDWETGTERAARAVVPWDLWYIDDLARLMLKRTLNRIN